MWKKCKWIFIVDNKFIEAITKDNKDYINKNVTLEIEKNKNNYNIIFEGQKTLKFEPKENYKYAIFQNIILKNKYIT